MKPMQLMDWGTIHGDAVFDLEDKGPRRFDIQIVTQGCSIIVHEGDAETLVFHGSGAAKVSFGITGAAQVEVQAKGQDMTSILLPDAREGAISGWVDGPSIVQLEPKNPMAVSPEIQAMMDAMNRNALRREMALRQEFERKLGQARPADKAAT